MHEAGGARGLAGVLRPGRAHQDDVRLAAVLGQVRVAKEAGRRRLSRGSDSARGLKLGEERLAALLELLLELIARVAEEVGRVAEAREARRPVAGAERGRVGYRPRHVYRLVVVGRVVVVGAV